MQVILYKMLTWDHIIKNNNNNNNNKTAFNGCILSKIRILIKHIQWMRLQSK